MLRYFILSGTICGYSCTIEDIIYNADIFHCQNGNVLHHDVYQDVTKDGILLFNSEMYIVSVMWLQLCVVCSPCIRGVVGGISWEGEIFMSYLLCN